MKIKVIIAGSRTFNDYDMLNLNCNQIFASLSREKILTGSIATDIQNMEIISGTAKGADTLGEQFAKQYHIPIKQFPAKWNTYGKRAGYLRNKEMAEYAIQDKESYGILIAFWDTKSKGTKHKIDLALNNNLRIFIVDTNRGELIQENQ